MLNIDNLTLGLRELLFDRTSFQFEMGKTYGLVAINGSGKTTFFRAIMNLIPVQAGRITYQNEPIEKHKNQFFFFESSEWFDTHLNGIDYLRLVKKLWQSTKTVDEVVKTLNMDSFVHLPINKYSLGMKQRLLIGMYLISDARVLIMDEIFNGLDEENRLNFIEQIKQIQKDKIILVSSHHRDDLLEISDVFIGFQNKKIVELSK